MADLNNKLSPNSLSSRKPFEPISHVWEIPAALYECKQLAIDGKNLALVALLESIIRVAGVDSHTWSNLPQIVATAGEQR